MKTKNYDKINIQNLVFVLFMPILVDFVHVLVRQAGMSSASSITQTIYMIAMIVMMLRTVLPIRSNEILKDIIMLIFMYSIFLFSYKMFPANHEYYKESSMIIMYFFYLPLCVFSIRKIRDYSCFWDEMYKMGKITFAFALAILLFTDYEKYILYMGFSYALLPFIASFYHRFREKNDKTALLLFFVGTVTMLSFGSRAALMFLFLYVGVYELIGSQMKIDKKIAIVLIIGIVVAAVVIYFENILEFLSGISIFEDSYIMQNALNGELFKSKTRDALYLNCVDRINTMGWEVGGFFSDRPYCTLTGNAYPHNIAYELLMSWGWIIGIAALIFLAIVMLRALFVKNSQKRDIAVFVIVTLFLRYIISGTYVEEGKFWIMLFLLVSLVKKNVTDRNEEDNVFKKDKHN